MCVRWVKDSVIWGLFEGMTFAVREGALRG